jgi:hypothetical protein
LPVPLWPMSKKPPLSLALRQASNRQTSNHQATWGLLVLDAICNYTQLVSGGYPCRVAFAGSEDCSRSPTAMGLCSDCASFRLPRPRESE